MTKPKRIDLTQAEPDGLLERVESDALEPGDCEVIRAMAETIAFLSQAVDQKGTSIKRLLRMIFGASTETTKNVLRELEKVRPQSDSPSGDTVDEEPEEERPKGHGRNSAADYTGADTTEIRHESLKPGDACPKCTDGRVYELSTPGVIVRVRGQAPLHKIFEGHWGTTDPWTVVGGIGRPQET
jgi:transposase